MDNLVIFFTQNIGNFLMAILGLFSGISLVILIFEILLSKELKDINYKKRLSNSFISSQYLEEAPDLYKNRKFLNDHKNNGQSPCDIKNVILIDESYLKNNICFFEMESPYV